MSIDKTVKKRKQRRGLPEVMFVLPSKTVSDQHSPASSCLQHCPNEQATLDGKEIKFFYESIVGLSPSSSESHALISVEEKRARKQLSPRKLQVIQFPRGVTDDSQWGTSPTTNPGVDLMDLGSAKGQKWENKLEEIKPNLTAVSTPTGQKEQSVDFQSKFNLTGSITEQEDQSDQSVNTPPLRRKDTKSAEKQCQKFGTKLKRKRSQLTPGATAKKVTGRPQKDTRSSKTKKGSMTLEHKSPKKDNFPPLTKENKVRMINEFLRSSQEGHIAEVRRYLQIGVKVDARDRFGWTALMCAAHAGNTRMVNFLLEQGASASVCDCTGKNAQDIACLTKHHKLGKVLIPGQKQKSHSDKPLAQKSETFYCKVCHRHFTDTSLDQHKTSTLHLFNIKSSHGVRGTSYFLPECNKGYQLMVKAGWNKDKGLGPKGQGLKFPVKTLLKRDRHGLGCDTDHKPRVTHFTACDTKAVSSSRQSQNRAMKASTLSRKQHMKKARREKEIERDFRQQFSME